MNRTIVLGVAAVLLFVVGVLASNTRIVEGIIPVTAYEADVNRNGSVNSIDLLGVALQFGQPVPTATPGGPVGPFGFSGMACADEIVTGNLTIPSNYHAPAVFLRAYDGSTTAAVSPERRIGQASGSAENYERSFLSPMPFSMDVNNNYSAPRTAPDVLVVVETYDGLYHQYVVVQCAIPPTPTPCPNGSIDIGNGISPPPANGHFCATFTPTSSTTPSPTATATPGGPTNTPVTGGQDISPPTLIAFDFTPKQVDTTSDLQVLTFTIHLADDLSGTSFATAYFRAPTTNQLLSVGFFSPQLISGTPLDGIWQYPATLPAFSEYGTWQLQQLYLEDALGNSIYLNKTQVSALGFPTTFLNQP